MMIKCIYIKKPTDAEITARESSQRARDDEMRAENGLSNGPRRVWKKGFARVFHDGERPLQRRAI
jgi:hypothetical protein